MKAVQINFKRSVAWRYIWLTAAVAIVVVLAVTAAKGWKLWQQGKEIKRDIENLQSQYTQRSDRIETQTLGNVNLRASSEALAKRELALDWNRLYEAVEAPGLAKVRLVQMGMDAGSGRAILRFELESMGQSPEVTAVLNRASGQDTKWELDRLERLDQGGISGSVKYVGVWRATLE
jgi:hypothetical protein